MLKVTYYDPHNYYRPEGFNSVRVLNFKVIETSDETDVVFTNFRIRM